MGFKKQHAEKENIRVCCFCCYFCKVIKNVGSEARPPVGNAGHHVRMWEETSDKNSQFFKALVSSSVNCDDVEPPGPAAGHMR